MIGKFAMGLPLYRQEQAFQEFGVEISRVSLARWMIATARELKPFISLIKSHIVSQDSIHADETTIQVLKGTGKAPTAKSYMWTLCSSRPGETAVWFEFHPSRSQSAANELLANFRGLLHVDGYDGYNAIATNPDVIRVGCWAHARRNFEHALKAGAKTGSTLSEQFIAEIQKLFLLERQWKDCIPEERLAGRPKESEPVLTKIRELLDKHVNSVPPKSKLAQAMAYLANDWPTFILFAEDGRAELSNNIMENYIRPFVVGRRNWLFADTVGGADASALLYSLIVTAKAARLPLRTYLKDVIVQVPIILSRKDEEPPDKILAQLTALLPWNWNPS
jgi:transposase